MSTALLQELHQEVRRLYIAGSELAAGDFRLKRLLPQFQQLGERAPVFKRLGEGISALIEPSDQQTQTSAENLQDLGLLLSSVLHTQGSTSPDGELVAVQSRPSALTTKLSYRKLARIQEALTTTGSGRYEVIVEAFEVGMFQDLRLLHLAVAALNDPYSEISEFAMNHILPSYGQQIVPHLIETFDSAGGKLEARKLRVIGRVGGEAVLELIYQAAESGAEDVRVTAIELLAGRESYEEALVGWTKDKKKAIREAAYKALAESSSSIAINRLHEALSSKDSELAAQAASKCSSDELTQRLVRDLDIELRKAAELKEDKKQLEILWTKIKHLLTALSEKQSEELYELVVNVTGQYSFYVSLGWLELFDYVAQYLEQVDTMEALVLLHELEQHNVRYLANSFRVSFRLLSPAQLYERYVESMRNKWKLQTNRDIASRKERLFSLIEKNVIRHEYQFYPMVWRNSNETTSLSTVVMMPLEQIAELWDHRWLDCFIEQNAVNLVCAFARPGHVMSQRYLLRQFDNDAVFKKDMVEILLCGLKRAEVNDAIRWETLVKALENKRNSSYYSFEAIVLEHLFQLPSLYKERLASIVPKYKYTAGEQLQYALQMMQSNDNETIKA